MLPAGRPSVRPLCAIVNINIKVVFSVLASEQSALLVLACFNINHVDLSAVRPGVGPTHTHIVSSRVRKKKEEEERELSD